MACGGGGGAVRRSRETSGVSNGQGGRASGGGGGGRGGGGGVGYFELEQRLGVAATNEGERSAEGAEASGRDGISITLKVYGDVWRWLADDKVCSLSEQVVEARFSLVHVTSVARKAVTIAQVKRRPDVTCGGSLCLGGKSTMNHDVRGEEPR